MTNVKGKDATLDADPCHAAIPNLADPEDVTLVVKAKEYSSCHDYPITLRLLSKDEIATKTLATHWKVEALMRRLDEQSS